MFIINNKSQQLSIYLNIPKHALINTLILVATLIRVLSQSSSIPTSKAGVRKGVAGKLEVLD
jgi:hypothetical protein